MSTSLRWRLASVRLLAGLAVAVACTGDRVADAPEAVRPLPVGAAVPSVRVTPVAGEPVDLAARVAERGALLVFYRGGW